MWTSVRASLRSSGRRLAGRGPFEKLAKRLLADLFFRDAARRAVVLQDHPVPREGRDVLPAAAILHVVGLGVLDAQPEAALFLLQLQPAALRERQSFALRAGAVRDDEARELAAVRRRPLGVDPQAGDLRTETPGWILWANAKLERRSFIA